jgi:hypothetical protein
MHDHIIMMVVEERLNSMIMFTVSTTATVVMLAGFGNFGIAQGQGNVTLTPEQRATICDPSDTHINTTESRICGIPKTPTNTTTEEAANTTATIGTETSSSPGTTIAPSYTSSTSRSTTTPPNQSSLYEQGYAKGVSDAKLVQSSSPASNTMSPDEVDCDSSVDPQVSNQDYCSGYQHGFVNTNNNALAGK